MSNSGHYRLTVVKQLPAVLQPRTRTLQSLYLIMLGTVILGCQPQATPEQTKLDHSGLSPLNIRQPDVLEYLSGGDATTLVNNYDAFSRRPKAIAKNFKLDGVFTSGDHLFRSQLKGIGPLLNTSSCQGCHLNDGRGVVPSSTDEPFTSTLVKIGDGSGGKDPIYGDQIQTFSIQSFITSDQQARLAHHDAGLDGALRGEAHASVTYTEVQGQYADSTVYSLRQPTYRFTQLAYGPFGQDIRFSVRVAPQAFGVGLLEAIPAEHILALADPNDDDQNGISGRVSMVHNVATGRADIGRFAYKAQTPSVLQQVAAAFNGDMGITSSLFPDESCSAAQKGCLAYAVQANLKAENAENAENTNKVDISDSILAMVEFYNRTLAVPARRGYDVESQTWQDDVLAGRSLFMETGCANCHTPRQVTHKAVGSVLGEVGLHGLTANAASIDVLSDQTIYPYTDLLLHDMGGACEVKIEPAKCRGNDCEYVQYCQGLADGLVQGDAGPSEWKTPPLWGLGLVQVVNPKATFLHDGRARNIEEAVLWHAGESIDSVNQFKQLSAEKRQQLLGFLASL
ncbi:MAG: thiol oxidoreductase [Paraglaciecola sp.]|nr:thiol oxidoreductase [Paraglaciecola sp.]